MPLRTLYSTTADPSSRLFRLGTRLPEWATGFVFRIFGGLVDFQRANGVRMEMQFDQPSGGDLPPLPIDEHWDGDGLLVFRYSLKEAEAWKAKGISVVNLSTEFPGEEPDFPRVTVDNAEVARMAAEHLASLGLRDFAYIHESTRRYSKERMDAFRHHVESLGGNFHHIDVPASDCPIPTRPKLIEHCLSSSLASLPKPCGIFCKDDIMAVWVTRLLKTLGIRCPEEMPVLGVSDDVVFCHTSIPALSSISYPGRLIGRAAADLLFRMMNGEQIPAHHRLLIRPDGLTLRESTGKVILADPIVTKALDYIRAHIPHQSVTVDEVARKTGVSRELLRQKFHATLGHSPKAQIEKLRCLKVCELLHHTDSTLEAIAEKCGFSGADDVCRFIKRSTGKTPGKIRAETRQ